MISSATRANATTSARLLTGGSSALLSGSGVPTDSAGGARSVGRTRNSFSPRYGDGLASATRSRTGSTDYKPHLLWKVPSRKREGKISLTEGAGSERAWNLVAPVALACETHQRDAHPIGADHDTDTRRQSQALLARDRRAGSRRSSDALADPVHGHGARPGAQLRIRDAKRISLGKHDVSAKPAGAEG